MEPIGLTTKKVIKACKETQRRNKGATLKQGVKKILTKQEQRHIKSYSLRDSRIFLGIDSSAWLYMFSLKKKPLLNNLNHTLKLPKGIIDIVFHLDTNQGHGE